METLAKVLFVLCGVFLAIGIVYWLFLRKKRLFAGAYFFSVNFQKI